MTEMDEYNDAKATIADAHETMNRRRLEREAEEDSRHLVTIRQISAIDDIPGADLIKVATVEGWKVVIKAGEFAVDDLCVFFEVDSFLPLDDERYEFLRRNAITWEGVEGARLRTIRLRKQLSQGLALPLNIFPEITAEELADPDVRQKNFTGRLGIMKWDKPVSAQLAGKAKGNFPSWLRKSDQERAQNMGRDIFGYDDELVPFDPAAIPQEALIAMMEKGELTQVYKDGSWFKVREATASRLTQYEVTIKLDGSSMTVYHRDGAVGVCSRNLDLQLEGNEGNSFVAMATSGLLEQLKRFGWNIALQGELMGPGIQSNRENFSHNRFFVYNIFDIQKGEFLSPEDREQSLAELNRLAKENGIRFEHVPVLHKSATLLELGIKNMDELLAYAIGPSITHSVREGLVFKALDGRHQWKAISNLFLEKEKD